MWLLARRLVKRGGSHFAGDTRRSLFMEPFAVAVSQGIYKGV